MWEVENSMFARKNFRAGKIGLISVVVAVALLMVSSVTAVPNLHGSTVVHKMRQAETAQEIAGAIDNIKKFDEAASERALMQSVYMVAFLTEQLILLFNDEGHTFDIASIKDKCNQLAYADIGIDMLLVKTQSCVAALSAFIKTTLEEKQLNGEEKSILNTLHSYMLKFKEVLSDKDGIASLVDEHGTIGVLQPVIGLVGLILLILVLLVRWMIRGTIKLIGGLVRLILLLFAGTQGVLTLSGVFVFFIGIMSYIGLRLFTTVSSPFFGFLAFRLTQVIGTVLGSISVLLSSVVALLLVFAIPLVIVAVILYFLAQQNGGGELADSLAPLVEAVFAVLINIPGLDGVLQQLWGMFGEYITGWPAWPF